MKTICHNEQKRCVCMNCGYSPLGEYHISVEKDIDPNDLEYDFCWDTFSVSIEHRCPICNERMRVFDSSIAPEVSRLTDYFYEVARAHGPVPDDVHAPHSFDVFDITLDADYYGPYIIIDLSAEYGCAIDAMLDTVKFRDPNVKLKKGPYQHVILYYENDVLTNKQNYSLERYREACEIALHEISIAVTELRKFARKLFSHEYYVMSQFMKNDIVDLCTIPMGRMDAMKLARQNRRKRKYKW